MIVYLDASVLLRIVLREANALAEWDEIQVGVTSDLTRVEAARVMDRLTVLDILQDEEIDERRAENPTASRHHPTGRSSSRARREAKRPTILGTLDAIHLASAYLYRDTQSSDEPHVVLATHDRALATAARALRFRVIGAPA